MKLTIVGCGDAFGSGGRMNTCFWLETAKATLVVDFGASALPALKATKLDPNRIDAIVLSHLHGARCKTSHADAHQSEHAHAA